MLAVLCVAVRIQLTSRQFQWSLFQRAQSALLSCWRPISLNALIGFVQVWLTPSLVLEPLAAHQNGSKLTQLQPRALGSPLKSLLLMISLRSLGQALQLRLSSSEMEERLVVYPLFLQLTEATRFQPLLGQGSPKQLSSLSSSSCDGDVFSRLILINLRCLLEHHLGSAGGHQTIEH